MFNTPILYLVFNRPIETAKSFAIIRALKPTKLYVAADGPREHVPSDAPNTQAVRNIISNIDWPCDLNTLYRTENLGCRQAVESAMTWFFDHETEGIILEDDILPNQAFFDFCATMLDKYRTDQRIFSINGCSVNYHHPDQSHGLTRYFNMWGWATWQRSYELVRQTWSTFTPDQPISEDKTLRKNLRLPVLAQENEKWLQYWQQVFTRTWTGELDTWDYQWTYTALKTSSYCIRPSANYVVNIGFGETATHHKFTDAFIANLRYTADEFSLERDSQPTVDNTYEVQYFAGYINGIPLLNYKHRLAAAMPKPLLWFIKKIRALARA